MPRQSHGRLTDEELDARLDPGVIQELWSRLIAPAFIDCTHYGALVKQAYHAMHVQRMKRAIGAWCRFCDERRELAGRSYVERDQRVRLYNLRRIGQARLEQWRAYRRCRSMIAAMFNLSGRRAFNSWSDDVVAARRRERKVALHRERRPVEVRGDTLKQVANAYADVFRQL